MITKILFLSCLLSNPQISNEYCSNLDTIKISKNKNSLPMLIGFFDKKYDVSPYNYNRLDSLVMWLKEKDLINRCSMVLQIITNNPKSKKKGLIGLKRAKMIIDYMEKKHNIPRSRFYILDLTGLPGSLEEDIMFIEVHDCLPD